MSDYTCSVDGCARRGNGGWGFCNMHYKRAKRTGSPGDASPARRWRTLEEAFALFSTSRDGDCLVWSGLKSAGGYGRITCGSDSFPAHRYAWERVNGSIPKGMVIDHMCWNRACVNIEHLRVVTQGQNLQNREGPMPGTRSGVRNVSWASREKRWVAKIKVAGKTHCGGYFTTIEEAERAALALRRELMPWSIK